MCAMHFDANWTQRVYKELWLFAFTFTDGVTVTERGQKVGHRSEIKVKNIIYIWFNRYTAGNLFLINEL